MKTNRKQINIAIGVIVLIVIALLLSRYAKRPAPDSISDNTLTDDSVPADDESEDSTPAAQPANRLLVSDQRAGSSLDIDEYTLHQPGFIAIHLVSAGKPGQIVAHSNLLPVGTRADLVINYPTKAGVSYIAMLHSDNGDGKFDATMDLPILDANGQLVMMMFSVVQ